MQVHNRFYNQETTQSTINDAIQSALERPSFVEDTTAGARTTDQCYSVTLVFQGDGGTLDGVSVQDGLSVSYSGTLHNQINGIAYSVPTSPNSNGQQRVLLAYIKP
jgi:hypothetical protein